MTCNVATRLVVRPPVPTCTSVVHRGTRLRLDHLDANHRKPLIAVERRSLMGM
jgi:hypothetical protein